MTTVTVNVAVVPLKFGLADVDARSITQVPAALKVMVAPTVPEQTALLEGSKSSLSTPFGSLVVNFGTEYTDPYAAEAFRFPASLTPPTLITVVSGTTVIV